MPDALRYVSAFLSLSATPGLFDSEAVSYAPKYSLQLFGQ